MDNDFYLLEKQDKLNKIIRPFQKELNRGQRLADLLEATADQEARLKVKFLVEQLDLSQQEIVLDYNQE